jgi:hypothetical protein
MDIRNKTTVDLIEPEVVQIVIRDDGKVIWVNADGICMFRACRVGTILVEDQRKEVMTKDRLASLAQQVKHP